MKRRNFIRGAVGLAASAGARRLAGNAALVPALVGRAQAQTGFPLDDLKASLDPATARIVAPGDTDYSKLRQAYNLRTLKKPQAIVLRTLSGKGIATLERREKAHFIRIDPGEWDDLIVEFERGTADG